MLRTPLLSLLLLLTTLTAAAQPFPTKVKSKWHGFEIALPKDWGQDFYSTSSVCACEGVILDHIDTDLRINVYFTDKAGLEDPIRNQVWDYTFDTGSAQPWQYTSTSGITFQGQVGQWTEQEDNHKVYRLDASRSDKQVIRLFIFGPAPALTAFEHQIRPLLNTLKLHKPKQ